MFFMNVPCCIIFRVNGKRAETFFKLSKGPLVDFYLGKLALRKNSSLIAQARLERFVETRPSKDLFWGAGMLALAELAYKEGNYQKAYLLSIKSKHESAQRAVLLHKDLPRHKRIGSRQKNRKNVACKIPLPSHCKTLSSRNGPQINKKKAKDFLLQRRKKIV